MEQTAFEIVRAQAQDAAALLAYLKIIGGETDNLRYKPAPERVVETKAKPTTNVVGFVLALPIFPGRLQPSIVSRSELNFRVRDGNGWTLALISTNFSILLVP